MAKKIRRSKLNRDMDKARKSGGIVHVPKGNYIVRGGSVGLFGLLDGDLIRMRKSSESRTK